MNQRTRIPLVVSLLGALLCAFGCHRKSDASNPGAAASAEAARLPALVLKDDTANLLLTWVDDQGDFHVVEHVADVPEAGRAQVRVVITDRQDGTGAAVYVADLRNKGADGAYPVTTMTRATWDDLGASKRKSRLEALAPKPPSSASAGAAPASSASALAAANVKAIIYGASWCGPCHQAEALLRSLGVNVTKLDIESNPAAATEMEEKLRRVHKSGGSIPVIDVMGQIFVGFSAGALRAAVQRAEQGVAQ